MYKKNENICTKHKLEHILENKITKVKTNIQDLHRTGSKQHRKKITEVHGIENKEQLQVSSDSLDKRCSKARHLGL